MLSIEVPGNRVNLSLVLLEDEKDNRILNHLKYTDNPLEHGRDMELAFATPKTEANLH